MNRHGKRYHAPLIDMYNRGLRQHERIQPRRSTIARVYDMLVLLVVGTVLLFGLIAWEYHADAKQLADFYGKRNSLEMKLRNFRVCLDMQENRSRWQGTGLEVPCEYDAHQLRDLYIPECEDALQSWNRTISERQALLEGRRSGAFGFLAREFGSPYD